MQIRLNSDCILIYSLLGQLLNRSKTTKYSPSCVIINSITAQLDIKRFSSAHADPVGIDDCHHNRNETVKQLYNANSIYQCPNRISLIELNITSVQCDCEYNVILS